ncbi:hypothetical protein CAOG_08629, partial [Capsaspora owczarzaki ATCC 30864]|uniref:hypothetical protein n=1 Tax=Capsaspora owczarzaki (strain ATCC 30864) TaxID=595528 RepID=UPI00035266E5
FAAATVSVVRWEMGNGKWGERERDSGRAARTRGIVRMLRWIWSSTLRSVEGDRQTSCGLSSSLPIHPFVKVCRNSPLPSPERWKQTRSTIHFRKFAASHRVNATVLHPHFWSSTFTNSPPPLLCPYLQCLFNRLLWVWLGLRC